ncbi:hypothetical protein DFJ74DRAFT_711928 [Hyaloraphidium curvatum]|nr:hypothetical protein DFJ74DRAFT_711928 [Hyaloraphidium curvatum]
MGARRARALLLAAALLPALAAPAAAQADLVEPCRQMPTSMACAAFVYPADRAAADLSAVCGALPRLPACSLSAQCRATPAYFPAGYCDAWTLLLTACRDPSAAGTPGCASFAAYCGNGTRIHACAAPPLENGSLEHMKVQGQYISVCFAMPNMASCDLCPSYADSGGKMLDCDVLADWSASCREMPGMSQCTAWKTMCTGTPSSPYCTGVFTGGQDTTVPPPTIPGSQLDTPPMLMYFHTNINTYFAFETWVPRNAWQYALSLVAVFLMGLVSDGLHLLRSLAERRFDLAPLPPGSYWPRGLGRDAARFVLGTAAPAWSYLLMLIVMSFNVGVFFAAAGGLGAGSVLWGYVRRTAWPGPGAARMEEEDERKDVCM